MAKIDQAAFCAAVYEVVLEIPKGYVVTYGQVAKMIGLDNYSRQVGSALSKLPSDSVIPWFRVVNHQGMVHPKHQGTYSRQKERLIKEGVDVDDNGKVSLKKFQWKP